MAIKDAFLAGILAHVPEADRGKAEAALEGLETNGLRQAEYSKLSDEAAKAKQKFDELYAKNTEWWDANKDRIKDTDALRAKVTELEARQPGDGSLKLPEGLITKKEVEALFDTTERGAVAFIAEANVLSLKHYKDFGEVLSVTDLLADPRVQKIG